MASGKEESTGEVENFRRRRRALDITAVFARLSSPGPPELRADSLRTFCVRCLFARILALEER